MQQNSNEAAGAAVVAVLLVIACLMGAFLVLIQLLITRKRRWGDLAILKKATVAPAALVIRDARTVRDMVEGESAYVRLAKVITAGKKHRVYVEWTADIEEEPGPSRASFDARIQIARLKRGFSIQVGAEHKLQERVLRSGYYAPVIEIKQAAKADPADRTG